MQPLGAPPDPESAGSLRLRLCLFALVWFLTLVGVVVLSAWLVSTIRSSGTLNGSGRRARPVRIDVRPGPATTRATRITTLSRTPAWYSTCASSIGCEPSRRPA